MGLTMPTPWDDLDDDELRHKAWVGFTTAAIRVSERGRLHQVNDPAADAMDMVNELRRRDQRRRREQEERAVQEAAREVAREGDQ